MHILYLFVRVLSGCLPACLPAWLAVCCTYARMHVFMHASMDGWMDGWMPSCAAATVLPRLQIHVSCPCYLAACRTHGDSKDSSHAAVGHLAYPARWGLQLAWCISKSERKALGDCPRSERCCSTPRIPIHLDQNVLRVMSIFVFGNQGSPHVLRVMNIFVFGNQGSPHVMRVMNIFVFGNQGSPPVLRVMSIFVFGNQGSPLA